GGVEQGQGRFTRPTVSKGRPMNFQTAVKTCLTKYVTVSGRAARSEYWYWVLFGVLVGIVANIVDAILFGGNSRPVSSIVSLAILLPGIAVSVRRLHDLDRSGWWYLLVLIPVVGWIVLLVWFIGRGTVGSNRLGSD